MSVLCDIVGKQFNKWIVLDNYRTQKGQTQWLCRCECGTEKFVYRSSLVCGVSKSCGMCGTRNGRTRELNPRWKGCGEIRMGKWLSFKDSAQRRNIPFLVTIEDGWKKVLQQNKKCALSGIDLIFYPQKSRNASLDRIDSTKPYTKDNIQWVHKDINRMKWELSESQFIAYCTLVYNNFK